MKILELLGANDFSSMRHSGAEHRNERKEGKKLNFAYLTLFTFL